MFLLEKGSLLETKIVTSKFRSTDTTSCLKILNQRT